MIFKFCAAAQNFLKIELVRQYAAFNAVFCLSVKVKGRQYAATNVDWLLKAACSKLKKMTIGAAVCRKYRKNIGRVAIACKKSPAAQATLAPRGLNINFSRLNILQ